MRCVVQYPAAARPYPGEVPMPVHEAGAGVPDPGWRNEVVQDGPPEGGCYIPLEDAAGENGCTGTTKSGSPCKGRAGPDRRCAAHKET
jgi:hypothetical protein